VGGETVDGESQLDAEQRDQHERGSGSLPGHSGDRMISLMVMVKPSLIIMYH